MDELGRAALLALARLVAERAQDRWALVLDRALNVEDDDGVESVLHDQAEHLVPELKRGLDLNDHAAGPRTWSSVDRAMPLIRGAGSLRRACRRVDRPVPRPRRRGGPACSR